ncbi:MAG: hypothetical protein Q8Q09_16185 [Deltaproteobacteria bacterium]|nr:hypothetical protein [Deltaproteobacteria bacterium]
MVMPCVSVEVISILQNPMIARSAYAPMLRRQGHRTSRNHYHFVRGDNAERASMSVLLLDVDLGWVARREPRVTERRIRGQAMPVIWLVGMCTPKTHDRMIVQARETLIASGFAGDCADVVSSPAMDQSAMPRVTAVLDECQPNARVVPLHLDEEVLRRWVSRGIDSSEAWLVGRVLSHAVDSGSTLSGMQRQMLISLAGAALVHRALSRQAIRVFERLGCDGAEDALAQWLRENWISHAKTQLSVESAVLLLARSGDARVSEITATTPTTQRADARVAQGRLRALGEVLLREHAPPREGMSQEHVSATGR